MKRAAADEDGSDKAVWISFADQMAALMVLFLVMMAVAMLSMSAAKGVANAETVVSDKASPPVEPPKPQAQSAVSEQEQAMLERVAQAARAYPGVNWDPNRRVIDFGDRARFQTGSHQLDDSSAELLRQFVPELLQLAAPVEQGSNGNNKVNNKANANANANGKTPSVVLGRVVVEGFADTRGDYLFNLNLSLQRAQRVLCVLLADRDNQAALTDAQREQVRTLFAVGGFSFNEQRESLDASRRIELRIEFKPSTAEQVLASSSALGQCRLPG
jgi:outer membrane protein OmpA-like peptidoglycan-associated protein